MVSLEYLCVVLYICVLVTQRVKELLQDVTKYFSQISAEDSRDSGMSLDHSIVASILHFCPYYAIKDV